MGREVRMVPPDWNHPKSDDGYIPLFGGSYSEESARWDEEKKQWDNGFQRDWSITTTISWKPKTDKLSSVTYEEWEQKRPEQQDYMPDWPKSQRTHFQMYENTSEGTPISPVFASAEQLARWLADAGASAFADMTATYDQWLAMISHGSAFSMVIENGTIQSGVAFEAK